MVRVLLVTARAAIAAIVLLAAVVAGVDGLYLLDKRGWLGVGPTIHDALPVLQLPGLNAQPLLRVAVVWLAAGAVAGLLLARESRPARAAVGLAIGAAALALAPRVSYALEHHLAVTRVLRTHVPGHGVWLGAVLLAAGAALAPTSPQRAVAKHPGRRQWGHDRRSKPLPEVPAAAGNGHIGLSRIGIIVTVVAWVAYVVWWLFTDLLGPTARTPLARFEAIIYLVIVTLLTASSLAYLLSRLGYMYRSRTHHRANRAELDAFYDRTTPALTAIVPSYQEDAHVIRKTLLSTALQEYPDMRVVLLIDDPHSPQTNRARELLAAARAVPGQIQDLLDGPAARYAAALAAFEQRADGTTDVAGRELARMAELYDDAVRWLDDLAEREEIRDHTDVFFTDHILRRLAGDLRTIAIAVRRAEREGASLPQVRVRQLYRRLAWTFRAELSSFERKRYASLSHEPNKAMNLNSYIGLMGGRYREIQTVAGPALTPLSLGTADLTVPNPDYVLTLDADSVVLPEYCMRLVYLLEQREQQGTAIAQTPYSAFPGSATRLERIAGATTDLQHIVHQGLTSYDATFWVGANAVIRKRALDDIAATSYVGDWEIRTYIKDLTVIEDTESTIDLAEHGWRLLNYPERLSYSATPPDFGSLCIQRRRWANGGLLLLPKLHRKNRAQRRRGERPRFGETFLRWNYMSSVSTSSVALLVLLAFPFGATLISPLLGIIALPYFMAMAADLRSCGYKRLDVFRIYGFNLLLVPVNLGGTAASLTQAITASRSTFARTPKVRDRTVAPLLFVLAPLAMVVLAAYTLWHAYRNHLLMNGVYAALNVVLLCYAIVAFIGVRYLLTDVSVHAWRFVYRPVTPRRRRWFRRAPAPTLPAAPDWRVVLQYGSADPSHWPKSPITELASGTPDGVGSHGVHLFRTVFQPIVDLTSRDVVGYEALTRFEDGVLPQHRLADAAAAGTAPALESALAFAAIATAAKLSDGAWLGLKIGTRTLRADAALRHALSGSERPLVIEVTEPATRHLGTELTRWRAQLPANVRWATDNTGIGSTSLSVVAAVRPDFVKLSRRALAGVEDDPVLQVQVAAMVEMADRLGCRVIASGIETETALVALQGLGVHCAQGYLLGRPGEPVGV